VSLANVQARALSLHAHGRREFLFRSIVRALAIGYLAVAAATTKSVVMQVIDGVGIVFFIGTFYWAYRLAEADALWREQSTRDAGAMASLEFYRRELVRQRDSVQFTGWVSGHLLVLTVIVMAVFIGAEWSLRHPQDVAPLLKAVPPIVRRIGPFVALMASWVAAMIAYRRLGRRRRQTFQREIDSLQTLPGRQS